MSAKSKKSTADTKYSNYIIGASALLCGLFFYQLMILLQNVKVGILGSPNTIALTISAILAVYILANTKNRIHKYIGIIILTVLVVGILLWLFGTTSAGNWLI